MKFSPASNTALPLLTRTGPPPIASITLCQSLGRTKWVVIEVPVVPSSSSFAPIVFPSAISTAPSGGIGVPPPVAETDVTGATRSVFGAAEGNGSSTASTAFGITGVRAPQAGVKSTT
jgi:hypothetical protein